MSDIAIKIENLSKVYKLYDKPIDRLKESLSISKKKYSKEHYALNNISFEINKGETVGIIGTNGSGKSTLLKIITGVLTQSAGNIEVNGKISALLELGAGFNPEYTGIENVYLNGTMMGYTREEMEQKVNYILEFADIGHFIDQPVKTYSSGMFARLAFAVAINVEPDILIVDEALSVGDVFFQNKCFKKFEELKENNSTILFVSHDISSIKQMCQRVLWINNGIQKMFGDKEEVCQAYFSDQIKMKNELNKKVNLKNINNEIDGTRLTDEMLVFPKVDINSNAIRSSKVEIKSFFIRDVEDNIVNYLSVEKFYSAHIVAEFHEKAENIIFGFVMENNKGVEVITTNSFICNDEKVINVNSECVMEIKFKFKLPKIQKGQYLLSPAVAQGVQDNHIMLTWLQNVTSVIIENEGYNLSLIEIENETELIQYNKKNIEFK